MKEIKILVVFIWCLLGGYFGTLCFNMMNEHNTISVFVGSVMLVIIILLSFKTWCGIKIVNKINKIKIKK